VLAVPPSELAVAIRRMQDEAEPLADYIARLTPKHAPVPDHLQQVVEVVEMTRCAEVFATISMAPRHGKTVTLAHGLSYRVVYDPACLNFYGTFGSDFSHYTSRMVRRLSSAAGSQLADETQATTTGARRSMAGSRRPAVGGDVTGRGCNSG
jgi:hypothetical protein